MSEELKPCPFCGSQAEVAVIAGDAYVECLGCSAEISMGASEDYQADIRGITERWNTRSTDRASFDAGWEYHKLLDTSQAHLSEAVKVLEPFARYLDEHKFDIDNKGNLLPDETQPGWTYLTAGDFRAAKAFLATIGEESHGG